MLIIVRTAELPRQLQPQLILLVPKLVSPMEHTTLAGVLLARLAEAHREGVDQVNARPLLRPRSSRKVLT